MSGQGPIIGNARPGKPGSAENVTIRFLADFCREHLLDEKILIVPSFSAGRQIGDALAGAGESWANLRLVTLPTLAHERAALDLAGQNKTHLTEMELVVQVDIIFRNFKARGVLEYFDRLAATPGVARALFRAIQELRFSGISSRNLGPRNLCVEAKGRDLVRILEAYEGVLVASGGIDLPGLFSSALAGIASRNPAAAPPERNADRNDAAWYLFLETRSLTRLEKEFLEAEAADKLVPVPRDSVHGLMPPRLFRSSPKGPAPSAEPAASDALRLPWLFDPASAPPPVGDRSVSLFRAVGRANECREILRRIVAEGVRYDSVEVIHPPGADYPAIFHVLSRRTGLPVTFSDGIAFSFTRPGRLFFGLIDWIENEFPVWDLCRLIEAGDLVVPAAGQEAPPPAGTVSRHLKGAAIGWGRERYGERLEALKSRFQTELAGVRPCDADDTTAARTESLERSLHEVETLSKVTKDLLAVFPGPSPLETVDFPDLCLRLADAVEKYLPGNAERRENSGIDGLALSLVLEALRQTAGAGRIGICEGIALPDALERLRTMGASITVGASSPLPGHLHLANYQSGGTSGRPLTFVVGLDEATFPGRGLQDPVLLDTEREAISPSLPTTADALRERLHAMAALLSSLRGRVIFSYPSYDIIEERACFPSSLILQVHRLVCGDAGLDYGDLEASLSEAAGFSPDSPQKTVDEMDWWLGRLVREGRLLDGRIPVRQNFPDLLAGVTAADKRSSPAPSAYDGIVTIDPARHDPVANHELSLSASRLELLARCPYGYFLKYILGVEAPKELERDPSRWLDPLERGSALHEILCEFMKGVTKRKERVDCARHSPFMDEIAARIISRWKADVPPPSERVFEKERRDMGKALEIFLNIEEKRPPEIEPQEFEKPFDGVLMNLGRGRSFALCGFIDRIDRTGPGMYKIVDYKTGSYASYEDLIQFGRGRIIQHALYAVAAEEILRREGKDRAPHVVESGYYFPTRKGEGREIMVRNFDRAGLTALLNDLMALISNGYFLAGPDAKCDFCDYAPVCGGRPDETKRKIGMNPRVQAAYDKLNAYD